MSRPKLARRPSETCQCGGRKSRAAVACRACYRKAARCVQLAEWDWLFWSFDRERFALALKHAGWDARTLALAAGLGHDTVRAWLSGRYRPRRAEIERAARVLCMEPCRACGGSGYVDPTDSRVRGMLARLSSRQRRTA